MIDQEEQGNVEYFYCLCSMVTNDARCTLEIKYSFAITKAAFHTKKNIFSCKMDLN